MVSGGSGSLHQVVVVTGSATAEPRLEPSEAPARRAVRLGGRDASPSKTQSMPGRLPEMVQVDGASDQVLVFVGRRLLAESVAIVFTIREPSTRRQFESLPEQAGQLRIRPADGMPGGPYELVVRPQDLDDARDILREPSDKGGP